ncbi:hypothetical protein CHS0354_010786 [Potamilus streckersoni]|uniref:BTB domain-containing protein n=1 Tax=Potamilus streckersoni TaxID=2493646 RepID=A0AAE0TA04_9BIVA|nr:hypothetical protein CHS0354_010786 [Potamilus streckersoni]
MADEKLMKGDTIGFATEMRKLVNNKEFSDIKFLVGPNRKVIYAHKCILSSRCMVFKAMFTDQASKSGGMDKETQLPFPDMSPDVFLAVLEFIYSNTVTLRPKIGIETMATALEYGLDDLRKVCVDYLVETLTVITACDCMQAAVMYEQEILKSKTLKFIEDHTQPVFASKGFQELSDGALIEILRSDNLKLDEQDIYKYVKEWAHVNSVVQSKPPSEVAQRVVQLVRLPIMSLKELDELEKENKKDNIIPVDSLSAAWKFHALKQQDPNNSLAKKRSGTQPRDHHKNLL